MPAEIPHSVVVERNGNLDTKTRSRSVNTILTLIEPNGARIEQKDTPQNREFVMMDGATERGSLVFSIQPDLDVVAIYKPGEPGRYAARNGVYVEIGMVREGKSQVQDGMDNNKLSANSDISCETVREGQSLVQYDLDGNMLSASADISLGHFEVRSSLDPESVGLIVGVCKEMNNVKNTPSPRNIAALEVLVSQTMQTSAPSQQISLPLA